MNCNALIREIYDKEAQGKQYTDAERDETIHRLLQHKEDQAPYFFPLPGTEIWTICGNKPKTKLWRLTAYALEPLILLHQWRPDDPEINTMCINTREFLLKKCYGKGCPQGECFGASLDCLRFYIHVFPEDTARMSALFSVLYGELLHPQNGKPKTKAMRRYFALVAAEYRQCVG